MLNWRQQTVHRLAVQPLDWVQLGTLFAEVEEQIPPHLALRRAHVYASRNVTETEIGLHSARWRLFLTHVRPLIERRLDGDKLPRSIQRNEWVRLKPDAEPCEDCGGERYISYWPSYNQKARYICPVCAGLIDPPEPPILEPEPKPVFENPFRHAPRRPKRKRPRKVYPVPEPKPAVQPKPVPVRSPPPEPMTMTVVVPPPPKPPKPPEPKPVQRDPVGDVWAFVLTTLENNERDNMKLRRSMRYAFDLGVLNECQLVTDKKDAEFRQLGWPNCEAAHAVLNNRAIRWLNMELVNNKQLLPPDMKRRRRWIPRLQFAYVSASLAVAQLVAGGRSAELVDVYEKLHEKHIKVKPPPPPKPRQPMIRRFLSSTKRAVLTGRWRER